MGAATRQGRLSRSRRGRARGLAGALCVGALALGCALPAAPGAGPRAELRQDARAQDPFFAQGYPSRPGHLAHDERAEREPREWLSVGVGVIDRESERVDLGDGLAVAIDIGMPLLQGDRGGLVPSIELGLAASSHAVNEPGFESADRLGLGRVSLGGRLALSPGARLSPYVRGGVFHRFELRSLDDSALPNQDEGGRYYGAGLDFARRGQPAWGLFLVVYEGDDGLEERMIGVNATAWLGSHASAWY